MTRARWGADRKGGNHDHEKASRSRRERQEEQAAEARQENPEGSRHARQGPRRWLAPTSHFLVMPSTLRRISSKARVGGSGQHHHIDLSADLVDGLLYVVEVAKIWLTRKVWCSLACWREPTPLDPRSVLVETR